MDFIEVDFDNVEKVRRRYKDTFKKETGASLSYLPFVSRATIDALRAFPTVNSSIDIEAKTMTPYPYVNLGIAVDLDQQGLVVPVIKDADSLNMRGVAKRITELAGAARGKKLGSEDMKGSTVTITNPGPFASYASSPIINRPNVAILCTDGVKRRPVAVGDAIAIHPTGIIGLDTGVSLPQLRQPGEPGHGVLLRHPDVGHRLPGLRCPLPGLLPGAVRDQDPGHRVRRLAEHRNLDHRIPAGDLRRHCRPTPGECVVDKKFVPDTVLSSGQTCRATADAIDTQVIWVVGSNTLGLAIIAAIACWSARETFRIHLNDLGNKNAVPIPRDEYDRIRTTWVDVPVGAPPEST